MAVPTITSITPSTGAAGGGELIKIIGTNFRLYVPPTSGYLGTTAPQLVQVLFSNTDAEQVFVESETGLWVKTPAYPGDIDARTFPPVSITIKNLDDAGVPIAGEAVTKTSAFTFSRDALRPPTLVTESPYVRISRILMHAFKRQILLDSGMATHADYSEDGLVIVKAKVPAFSLLGPDVQEDDYGSENVPIEETQGEDVYVWPHPEMRTLEYRLVGTAQGDLEYLRLMQAAERVVRRTPWLLVQGDVPAGTILRLPLVATSQPTTDAAISANELKTFSMIIQIRRVPILYLPPSLVTKAITSIELQTQKLTGSLVETINV